MREFLYVLLAGIIVVSGCVQNPPVAPPELPQIQTTPPEPPSTPLAPTAGKCPQLLRPAEACGALQGIDPIYIERGQTVAIEGGFMSLPSFATETFECLWDFQPQPSASDPNDPNQVFASQQTIGITVKGFENTNDAEFSLQTLKAGFPSATIQNNEFQAEQREGSFPSKTRIHAKIIGNYMISIQQTIGDNVAALCASAEENNILQTFQPE